MTSARIEKISLVEFEKNIRQYQNLRIRNVEDCNSFLRSFLADRDVNIKVCNALNPDLGSYIIFIDMMHLHNQKIYVYQQYQKTTAVKGNLIKVVIEDDTELPSMVSSYLDKIALLEDDLDTTIQAEDDQIKIKLREVFGPSNISTTLMGEVLLFMDQEIMNKEGQTLRLAQKVNPDFTSHQLNHLDDLYGNHILAVQNRVKITADAIDELYLVYSRKKNGNILYVESLNFGITGDFKVKIFCTDPPSEKGGLLQWNGNIHEINAFKQWKEIRDTTFTNESIRNKYIEVKDFIYPRDSSIPTIVSNELDFHVTSDQFAAINTFYHWNYMLAFIRDELKLADLFKNINFPILIDINANRKLAKVCCPTTHNYEVGYEVVKKNSSAVNNLISMATSNRIGWHELMHIVLYEAFNYPTVLFAEGTGDAVAAIMHDPDKALRDKLEYRTYPWTQDTELNNRFHNRKVEQEYEFRSNKHSGKYEREQTFSSALYRFYRCIGGDSDSRTIRSEAAKYTIYLHLKAMAAMPDDNLKVEHYLGLLMNVDRGGLYMRFPGNTLRKVMRWAFRQQGAYKERNAPRGIPGYLPEVDLSLRGDHDSYAYNTLLEREDEIIRITHNCSSVLPDAKNLIAGKSNFIWINLHNIGKNDSSPVYIHLYVRSIKDISWGNLEISSSCDAKTGFILSAKSNEIYGPFEFNPTQIGEYQLFAVAQCLEDQPIAYIKSKKTNDINVDENSEHDRFRLHAMEDLISFDNNMAIRTIEAIKQTPTES